MKLKYAVLIVLICSQILAGCQTTAADWGRAFLEVMVEALACPDADAFNKNCEQEASFDNMIGNSESQCKKVEVYCPKKFRLWQENDGSIGCSCKSTLKSYH